MVVAKMQSGQLNTLTLQLKLLFLLHDPQVNVSTNAFCPLNFHECSFTSVIKDFFAQAITFSVLLIPDDYSW